MVFDVVKVQKFVPVVLLTKNLEFFRGGQGDNGGTIAFQEMAWNHRLWKTWNNTIFSYFITESVSAPK